MADFSINNFTVQPYTDFVNDAREIALTYPGSDASGPVGPTLNSQATEPNTDLGVTGPSFDGLGLTAGQQAIISKRISTIGDLVLLAKSIYDLVKSYKELGESSDKDLAIKFIGLLLDKWNILCESKKILAPNNKEIIPSTLFKTLLDGVSLLRDMAFTLGGVELGPLVWFLGVGQIYSDTQTVIEDIRKLSNSTN